MVGLSKRSFPRLVPLRLLRRARAILTIILLAHTTLPAYSAVTATPDRSPIPGDGTSVAGDTLRQFRYIALPDSLSSVEERARYAAEHFWDLYDFADTSLLDLPQVSAQGFANYLNLLTHIDTTIAYPSMRRFVPKTTIHPRTRQYFLELAETYLYSPLSPIRNEDLYRIYLYAYLSDPTLPEVLRLRPQTQLDKLLKNRVGSRASDFKYKTIDGRSSRLYKLKTPYILLYFNNPECNYCQVITSKIKNNPSINRMIEAGDLTVLSLYPDKQLDLWYKHAKDFPKQWIVACDPVQAIDREQLYDLQAIPSLYLLDQDKTVLLKDAAYEQIEQRLNEAEEALSEYKQ